MRAVTFAEYGPPSVLEVTTVAEPHAGPGQVRIAVRAAAVNPWDWKVRAGYVKDFFHVELPAIVGNDAAGVVDEVGDGVEGIGVGDEVFGFGHGVTSELAILEHFAGKPASIGWAEAAGIPTVAETALRTLELLAPASGQTLLVEGAAGGVGSAAVQIAVADGITVIGTASPGNHDYLRSLGAVPTTYGPGLKERVAELAPNGVDAALDTSGRGSLAELVELTGSPDRVVTIADMSAADHGVRMSSGETRAFHALPKVAGLIEQGKYAVAVEAEYPFEEAAAAHARSEAGHVRGKIVLIPA